MGTEAGAWTGAPRKQVGSAGWCRHSQPHVQRHSLKRPPPGHPARAQASGRPAPSVLETNGAQLQ